MAKPIAGLLQLVGIAMVGINYRVKGHSNARFTVLLVSKEYVAISTVCAFVPLKEEYIHADAIARNELHSNLELVPLSRTILHFDHNERKNSFTLRRFGSYYICADVHLCM